MEAQDPFKSKILALEMLASIVDNCGDRLMAAERFVDAVMPKYFIIVVFVVVVSKKLTNLEIIEKGICHCR